MLALTASVFTFFQSTAHAAINNRITISDLSLVISSTTGQDDPSDTSVRVDDIMRLSFSWDATSADPTAGDSFRIGLPELFRNREQITQDLKVSHAGQDVSIGECVLGEQDITCTFNGQLDTLKAQGFTSVKGSGSALVQVIRATDQANASIDANGSITAVPIPGGSIADNTGFHYTSERLRKWALGVTSTSDHIDWELSFGFPGLQHAMQGSGKEITVDGQTVSTIVFTDQIGPGQKYSTDTSKWRMEIGTSKDRAAIYGEVTKANGTDTDTTKGDYNLEVQIDGNQATITATGPFLPDTNYHIYYVTTPTSTSGKIQPGVVYTNNASVQGTDISSSYDSYYVRSFDINVDLQPGFGGFKATKLLSGPGASEVPADAEFELTVDYALPGGATTDAYPGWTAPGTVNADKTGGRTSMKLTAGQGATYNGTFPVGTVLTFSEDTTKASAAPQGFSWAEPSFTVDEKAASTVTIADQRSHLIEVKNTADLTVARTGQFSVTKKVLADNGNDFTSDTFTFSYTCNDGTQGDLEVPGDGTLVNSPELPAGTTCDITEDTTSAAKPGFSLAPGLSTGNVTIKAGEVSPVTATNVYSTDKGTFTVAKSVAGVQDFATDSFDIDYVCTPPADAGSPQKATLRVTADGKPVQGPVLPAGTSCVISESEETKARAGYAVTTAIKVDGAATNAITITKGGTAKASVTNTYTPEVGSFQVSKTVSGSAASQAPASFKFDYTCTIGDKTTKEGTLPVEAGKTASVSDVPVGSSCTVTEKDASVKGIALETVMSVNDEKKEGPVTFTIESNTTVKVEATNTYKRTTGTFAVVKEVTDGQPIPAQDAAPAAGDGDSDAPSAVGAEALAALRDKEFAFAYTCDDPDKTAGTIKVKGDGKPVQAEHQLPVGTVCTVSEDEKTAQAEGFNLVAPPPGKVTIGEGEAPVVARFTNLYTPEEPQPAPSPSPTPSESTPPSPAPEPSPSHTCLTPAPSASVTPSTPGSDPSASGTPDAGTASPSSEPSTDPCSVPSPHSPGGSTLATTGASIGAVFVAIVGLVGGAAVLSHRRRA